LPLIRKGFCFSRMFIPSTAGRTLPCRSSLPWVFPTYPRKQWQGWLSALQKRRQIRQYHLPRGTWLQDRKLRLGRVGAVRPLADPGSHAACDRVVHIW
jgi:hypothetical protein